MKGDNIIGRAWLTGCIYHTAGTHAMRQRHSRVFDKIEHEHPFQSSGSEGGFNTRNELHLYIVFAGSSAPIPVVNRDPLSVSVVSSHESTGRATHILNWTGSVS